MPAGHDVERTRCVELRAFVPNEVPVDDVDLDVEVAASDGVVVRFYLHHDEEEARRKKAGLHLNHDAQMEEAERGSSSLSNSRCIRPVRPFLSWRSTATATSKLSATSILWLARELLQQGMQGDHQRPGRTRCYHRG